MYACTSYLLLDLGVSKGESNQGVVGLDNHGTVIGFGELGNSKLQSEIPHNIGEDG